MSTVHGTLLIIIALIEACLGVAIFARDKRNRINQLYAVFIFAVALWVFGNAPEHFLDIGGESIVTFFLKLVYVAAAIIASAFLVFSYVFPFQLKPVPIFWKIIISLFPILTFFVVYFSDWLTYSFVYQGGEWSYSFGEVYNIFGVVFLVLWVYGLVLLISKMQRSDGVHRWQLKWLTAGMILSLIVGVTTNLILPWFGINQYGYVGPELSVIWLLFTSYIILKPRLGGHRG